MSSLLASARRLSRAYAARTGSFRPWLPLLFGLAVVNAGLQMAIPPVAGFILDLVLRDAEAFVEQRLVWVALLLVVATLAYAGIEYWQKIFLCRTSCQVKAVFQRELYRHLLHLDDAFYQRNRGGDIASRLTKDLEEGVNPALWSAAQITFGVASVVGATIILFLHSHWLGLLFLSVLPVWALFLRHIGSWARSQWRRIKDDFGQLNARASEDMSNQSLIRLSGKEAERAAAFRAAGTAYRDLAIGLDRKIALAWTSQSTVLTFVLPLVVLLLCASSLRQELSPGALLTVFGTWMSAVMPLSLLGYHVPSMASGLSSMERVFDFFDARPEVQVSAAAKPLRLERAAIRLAGVTFGYPGNPRPVLDAIDLDIPGGTRLALVGPSGSGKSTLAQLVMRFHDPSAGSISIDGQDLRSLHLSSLRRSIGLVQQETQLWSGSLRDNLAFIAPEATEERLWTALAQAELADFVRQTAQGLDTLVGERGVRLSGGQRQRLALARLFLQSPRIVILDEATSALDGLAEQAVQAAMQRLMAGRTAIIIAHRLATVVDCDRIIVLESGRITGAGTHSELRATHAVYADMCSGQGLGIAGIR